MLKKERKTMKKIIGFVVLALMCANVSFAANTNLFEPYFWADPAAKASWTNLPETTNTLVVGAATKNYNANLSKPLPAVAGGQYHIKFACTSEPVSKIELKIQKDGEPWTDYANVAPMCDGMVDVVLTSTTADAGAWFHANFGAKAATYKVGPMTVVHTGIVAIPVSLAPVALASSNPELLEPYFWADPAAKASWTNLPETTNKLVVGVATKSYNANLSKAFPVAAKSQYRVVFDCKSNPVVDVELKMQQNGEPWKDYAAQSAKCDGKIDTILSSSASDPNAWFHANFGANVAAYEVGPMKIIKLN
jgi:hypothetical protein